MFRRGDMINHNQKLCRAVVDDVWWWVVQGKGPGRRDRQVLVAAVGSAVAQVQPAGPRRAARRARRHPRRVGGDPQSGQALRRFTGQSLRLPRVFSVDCQAQQIAVAALYIYALCNACV